jgi:hypothetical protein
MSSNETIHHHKEKTMNDIAVKAKNFVVAHKTGILVTALVVTTTACVLMKNGISQHNQFLKDHDLFEEFYNLVD